MKPTWADILPRPTEPTEFKLATEDPRDADEEVATTDWPLPKGEPWAPKPRKESLLERFPGKLERALSHQKTKPAASTAGL